MKKYQVTRNPQRFPYLMCTAFLAAFIIPSQPLRAQWSRVAPNVYLTTATDNVGVGLVPAYKLDVDGDININNSTTNSLKMDGSDILHFKPAGITGGSLSLGYLAGTGPMSGGSNTFLGYEAGTSNNQGSGNTFVGASAGRTNITGSNCTFLGSMAGYQTTGNDNTLVGAYAGHFNTAHSNSFFGTLAGQNNNDAFSTFLGVEAGRNSTGGECTYTGYKSGENTNGANNTFYGVHSGGTILNGTGNTMMGQNTGSSSTSSLNNAVAVGFGATCNSDYALALGTGAEANGANAVAIGKNAVANGANNIILGNADHVVGINTSTVPANQGLYINNSGTSSRNLGMLIYGNFGGTSSGDRWLETGRNQSNAPLQFQGTTHRDYKHQVNIGQYISNGKGNAVVNWHSSDNADVNNFDIVYTDNSGNDRKIAFFKPDISHSLCRGRFFVGNEDTTGTIQTTDGISAQGFNQFVGESFFSGTNQYGFTLITYGGVQIKKNYFGVGLEVFGDVLFANDLYVDGHTHLFSTSYITGSVITSDRRFKEGITQIDNPLEVLKKINGYHYNFRKDVDTPFRFPDKRQYGLIAQEVQEVLPELVDVVDSNGHLGVNYDMIIPFLVEAVKEQQREIDNLKQKIGNPIELQDSDKEPVLEPSVPVGHLMQNTPNPFDEETFIQYSIDLPSSTPFSASIWVTDLAGNLKIKHELSESKGEIVLASGTLQTGIYLYTLIVNDAVVDAKKMIVK